MFNRQTKKFCAAIVEAIPPGISKKMMGEVIGDPIGLQDALKLALYRPLRDALISAFALNMVLVAQFLLNLLKPKLTAVEKEYVEVDGPQICGEWRSHAAHSQFGGCDEGRAARRAAVRLEEAAKKKLTQAAVPEERQKLLETLVMTADGASVSDFPPKKLESIRYFMGQKFQKGELVQFMELAKLLEAPSLIQGFLVNLYRYASELAEVPVPTTVPVTGSCPKCHDTGVIEGNNELPCDCPAGDVAEFSVAEVEGLVTGAEVKRHFLPGSPEPITAVAGRRLYAHQLPGRRKSVV